MGNKILVSVFDSERTAFEGLTALKDLHRDGDITLYASTVIAKDPSGTVSVRQAADRGPIGTLVGIVTGGLVGLLGGPAGVAVGAYVGGFGGLMYDLFNAGVSMDFVDEVAASLTPGKAAVVADVDETWVTPIDTRLGALGGTTFRRLPGEVIDDGADPRDRRRADGARAAPRRASGVLGRGEGERGEGDRRRSGASWRPWTIASTRRSPSRRPSSRRASPRCASSRPRRVRASGSRSRPAWPS